MPSETPISGLTDHAASSPIQSTVEDKKTRMVQAIMTFLDKHVSGIRPEDCKEYANLLYDNRCGDIARVAKQVEIKPNFLTSIGIDDLDAGFIKAALIEEGLLKSAPIGKLYS